MNSLVDQAHENFLAMTRWSVRLDPAGQSLDQGGVVGLKGALDWPSARWVLRSEPTPAKEWVETASKFLFSDGKTGCAFARIGTDDDLAAVLLEQGWAEFGTTPEMVCEAALARVSDPEGFRIRLATTPDDVLAYAEVAGEAFANLAMPAESVRDALANPEHFLTSNAIVAVGERDDGAIVAGATAIMFADKAYVGWVAVANDARGNGLGDPVTRLVTNEAFARGADLVTLEASHFGENTYARMGYREIYRYRILIKI
jgi:ribosomal protein S18 acetylase RimI-like enzyme